MDRRGQGKWILDYLVRAECVRCPWLLPQTKVATILGIGPSGVHALPVAAGTNEGGHYFRYFSSSSSSFCGGNPPAITPDGIVVGF